MEQHWFVGGIAILTGLFCVAGGIANAEMFFQLFWVGRTFDARWGRTKARVCYVLLGLGMILLGVFISAGYRIEWRPEGPRLHQEQRR